MEHAACGGTREIAPDQLDPRGGNSFECFIDAIRGLCPTPVPGEVGHCVQGLLDAIVESGAQGGVPAQVEAG